MLLSPDRDTHHVALMDQAGSGKTLAYLLPLLQQLKDEEAKQGKGPLAQPGQPRLVVLAPTTGKKCGGWDGNAPLGCQVGPGVWAEVADHMSEQ